MIQFFQSVMGRKFYEGDVPRLVRALERIARALERYMDVKTDLAELRNALTPIKMLLDEETFRGDEVADAQEAMEQALQIINRMWRESDAEEKEAVGS